jgi:hypothetical protein
MKYIPIMKGSIVFEEVLASLRERGTWFLKRDLASLGHPVGFS